MDEAQTSSVGGCSHVEGGEGQTARDVWKNIPQGIECHPFFVSITRPLLGSDVR